MNNGLINQLIPIFVGIIVTALIAIVGVLTPKLFAYIKIKIGSANFTKFIGFAQFAEKNVIAYIKLHPEIKNVSETIYVQFKAELVALTGGAVTDAQVDSLFFNIAQDICKELGIDIKDFDIEKLGVGKPLFGEVKTKTKPLF